MHCRRLRLRGGASAWTTRQGLWTRRTGRCLPSRGGYVPGMTDEKTSSMACEPPTPGHTIGWRATRRPLTPAGPPGRFLETTCGHRRSPPMVTRRPAGRRDCKEMSPTPRRCSTSYACPAPGLPEHRVARRRGGWKRDWKRRQGDDRAPVTPIQLRRAFTKPSNPRRQRPGHVNAFVVVLGHAARFAEAEAPVELQVPRHQCVRVELHRSVPASACLLLGKSQRRSPMPPYLEPGERALRCSPIGWPIVRPPAPEPR